MSPNEAFRAAVLGGDRAEARRALAAGADVDLVVGATRGRRDGSGGIAPDGFTALHVAAYHDDAELCELLLELGAAIHAQARFGAMPIEVAVRCGSPAVARLLLGAGVDPNGGARLLTAAAGRGDLEMIQVLLEAGARGGLDEALSAGCGERGNAEIVRALIAAGAQPAPIRASEWSVRVVALDRRRFDCLELLRESFRPRTLIEAVIDGDLDDVEQRLRAGAIVDEPLNYGITALGCAARMGHHDVALRLLGAGAAVDRKTLWGTPVFCALLAGHLDLAGDLHARGASLAGLHGPLLNARGTAQALAWLCDRQPPEKLDVVLCTAIGIGDRAVVQALLERGANPNGADAWGRPALSLAVDADRVEIVRLLLDAGADPKARDGRGHPILHYVLTYDGVTEDWLDPDYDRSRYDRDHPALRSEAVRLILDRGAPLPWDDELGSAR